MDTTTTSATTTSTITSTSTSTTTTSILALGGWVKATSFVKVLIRRQKRQITIIHNQLRNN